MTARADKVKLQDIQGLRGLFLQEVNVLIRYHAWHEAGWTDSYLLTIDDAQVGYASVKGRHRADRDTVFEFFVIPSFRKVCSLLFRELVATSAVRYVECQSNEPLLPSLIYEFAFDISADVFLFADHVVTEHAIPGAVVRRRREDDQIFTHRGQPVGDYVVELGGDVVATGGFMLQYNMPFADLYMEVREDHRKRGLASFLLQELKKECYLAGRVPAARCDFRNAASRAALRKAGLRECGFMLTGTLQSPGC